MSNPTYIYKLVPSELIIQPIPDRLPLSPLDTADGFIHLSTAAQLPGTLRRYFAKENKMYILRLDYKQVEKNIRWEDPRGRDLGEIGAEGIYPHFYGQLGSAQVENVFVLEKDNDDWDLEIVIKSTWLIY